MIGVLFIKFFKKIVDAWYTMRYNIIKKGGKPMKKKQKKKIKSFIKLATKAMIALATLIASIAKLIEALK